MITLNKLMRKTLTAIRGSLRSTTYPLRKDCHQNKNIVACVFSTGEHSEEQSIASIKKQPLPIIRIELIKNVCPISAASNAAIDMTQGTDYLLWVDADMILKPDCLASLVKLMSPHTLYALAPLKDPVFGKVGYIKLLNMQIVRQLDLKFRDVLGCDIDFCNQARVLDPSIQIESYTLLRRPLGLHHPTYTARELFRKNQIEKKKRDNVISAKLLLKMAWLYLKSGNAVLLAGILGEIMPNPDKSTGESTPKSGLQAWDQARMILGDVPEELTFGFSDLKDQSRRSIKNAFDLFRLLHN